MSLIIFFKLIIETGLILTKNHFMILLHFRLKMGKMYVSIIGIFIVTCLDISREILGTIYQNLRGICCCSIASILCVLEVSVLLTTK